MENGQITAIILAGLICGTITIGVIVQAWVTGRGRGDGGGSGGGDRSMARRLDALEERLYTLEQAIDTVAVEIERGTEAQRFTAKLLAERLESLPAARVGHRHSES
jgi:hypothetical protein